MFRNVGTALPLPDNLLKELGLLYARLTIGELCRRSILRLACELDG